MDAIELLQQDHKKVKELFERFTSLSEGAYKSKGDTVERLIRELTVHAEMEEAVFYPTVRQKAPDFEGKVLEDLEEHHLVKFIIEELKGLDPHDEHFDAKVSVLKENVKHHIKEEEAMFPKLRKQWSKEEMAELGSKLEAAKREAQRNGGARKPPPAQRQPFHH